MKRFLLILMAALCAAVAMGKPLDEIQSYEIWVEPREDATLDMRYKIAWKVLDSTKEGPLTWVKIGVPNGHLDSIKPLSPNIREAMYYENNGQYIRIDLDKEYRAGQTVVFEYSFHQRYMFQYRESEANGKMVLYDFTPGWFDDIDVKSLIVRWKADGVKNCSEQRLEDGYYVKETKAPEDYKLNKNSFKVELSEDYDFAKDNPVVITVDDKKKPVETGVVGPLWAVTLLSLSATAIYLLKKKKSEIQE